MVVGTTTTPGSRHISDECLKSTCVQFRRFTKFLFSKKKKKKTLHQSLDLILRVPSLIRKY